FASSHVLRKRPARPPIREFTPACLCCISDRPHGWRQRDQLEAAALGAPVASPLLVDAASRADRPQRRVRNSHLPQVTLARRRCSATWLSCHPERSPACLCFPHAKRGRGTQRGTSSSAIAASHRAVIPEVLALLPLHPSLPSSLPFKSPARNHRQPRILRKPRISSGQLAQIKRSPAIRFNPQRMHAVRAQPYVAASIGRLLVRGHTKTITLHRVQPARLTPPTRVGNTRGNASMATIQAKLRVRPLRLAFAVDPQDRQALRRIVRANSCLWGGRYNYIIPVFKRTPTRYREKYFSVPSAAKLINGLIEAFQ